MIQTNGFKKRSFVYGDQPKLPETKSFLDQLNFKEQRSFFRVSTGTLAINLIESLSAPEIHLKKSFLKS